MSISDKIRQIAEHIEKGGNSGCYELTLRLALGDGVTIVLNRQHKSYRDGILFYSSGHGWRVRKNPHWREVWNKRFKFGE